MANILRYFLLASVAISGIFAFERALLVSPAAQKRSVALLGGWGTNQFNQNCPTGSSHCYTNGCCPSELTCLGTHDPVNVICCPGGTDCNTALQMKPACADSSWTLWNATTQGQYGGFFCCVGGQVGDTSGNCQPNATVIDPSSLAISIAPATQSATPTTMGSHGGGVASVLSSLVSQATAKSTETQKSSAAHGMAHMACGSAAGALMCLLAAML